MVLAMRAVPAILWLLTACGQSGGSAIPAAGSPTTPSVELPEWDGTLEEARDRILEDLFVGRDTDAFAVTDPADFTVFSEIAARLLAGDLDVQGLAAQVGYEAVLARDTYNDRDVVIVWEPAPLQHSGALMVALDDQARPVVIESPHSLFDGMTGYEGFDFFVSLRAQAWMANTAHRCANAENSPCAGSSTVCGEGTEPYRVSDVAHATATAFQAWHEGLLDSDPALIAVQNHGFGHDDGEPESYVSNGSAQPAGPDELSNRLAAELDAVLPVGAASCNRVEDEAIARFCATTNTQGRHANGADDGCSDTPSSTTGRFLHVEQSWELRNNGTGDVHRGLIRDALDAVLPL